MKAISENLNFKLDISPPADGKLWGTTAVSFPVQFVPILSILLIIPFSFFPVAGSSKLFEEKKLERRRSFPIRLVLFSSKKLFANHKEN
jgi:hypothetical protein